MKKTLFLFIPFVFSIGIANTIEASQNFNMDDSKICHEIAWHYALAMQDEFSMTGAEMELIYEDTYIDCESWE